RLPMLPPLRFPVAGPFFAAGPRLDCGRKVTRADGIVYPSRGDPAGAERQAKGREFGHFLQLSQEQCRNCDTQLGQPPRAAAFFQGQGSKALWIALWIAVWISRGRSVRRVVPAKRLEKLISATIYSVRRRPGHRRGCRDGPIRASRDCSSSS